MRFEIENERRYRKNEPESLPNIITKFVYRQF